MIILSWAWFLMRASWAGLSQLGKAFLWLAQLSMPPDFRAMGALGTARWATRFELFWYGVFRGNGPIVGAGLFGQLMRFNRDGIIQVFASTGSGKGLGIVVPTLLDYPGSIVVTDVKGENYAITARQRAKFGKVVMLAGGQTQSVG